MTDDVDDAGYESGPFCRHFGDPSECPEVCSYCRHRCRDHVSDGDCSAAGCDCERFHDGPKGKTP